ncbi:MAG TPA: serine hydrolase, partial [Propionibacteriaceae bacterium]
MIGSQPSRPPFPVTLDNWQSADQLGWTFQHMAEIFTTAAISRSIESAVRLPTRSEPVHEIVLVGPDGVSRTVGEVIAATNTDGWMVLDRGTVIAEHYLGELQPSTPHLLMSVSKSIVGIVVGELVGRGLIDVEAPLTRYVPELGASGYAGATVRNVLDMRSGIKFSENYLDPYAEVRLLDQAFGWAPRLVPDVPETLRGFLRSLTQAAPHGGAFNYRSCETDILGWVCEAATGRWFPELASDLVWSRIGAEFDANIGLDAEGTGMFDGGISATLGDLARFGMMILGEGTSLTGAQVVAPEWIADTFAGAPDSRQAFADSPGDNRMPGGMYRNQFWFPYA